MTIKRPHPGPPRWLDRLVERFCPPEQLEEALGDLHERFHLRVERFGERTARKQYWIDVLSYLQAILFQRQPSHFTKPSVTDMLSNYLKIAGRNIYRHKAYSFINITGLALGLACVILNFTIVKYHLSFDTFHSKKDRIYRIITEFHQDGISRESNVPQPMGKAFTNDYSFAEKVAMVYSLSDMLVSVPSSKDNRKFEEGIAFAESDFFEIMDFPTLPGGRRSPLDNPGTAVITERIARKFFGDQNPINQVFRVDNKWDFKVTAVLKDLPINTDRRDEIYVSYNNLKDYNSWLAGDSWQGVAGGMNCLLLLKPNISPSEVESALPDLSKKYYNKEDAKLFHFKLQPLSDFHFNPELGGYIAKGNLWALSLIGVFLLITACVNFVNLATAQALRRPKEIGVRKVLGGQRTQIFWQFMTETTLITAFAMATAVILAQMAIPYITSLLGILSGFNILTDVVVLTFLPMLLLAVTFLAGFYPGILLAGFQPVMALKGNASTNHGGLSVRRMLVIAQFAISQLLIIGTIVIANQMRYTMQSDMGFKKDAIVMVPVPKHETDVINSLHNELARLPGVENVSFCSRAPASPGWASVTVYFDTRTEKEKFDIVVKAGDDRYVSTFDLQVIAGRNLQHSDTVREFLINETALIRFGVSVPEDAIGKKIRIGLNNRKGTVVGVVKDFHNNSFHETIDPICITSSNDWYSDCAVSINPQNLNSTVDEISKVWNGTFPDNIYTYTFLDEQIARFYEMDNVILWIIQVAAGIAIIIGCLGLYGLVSFMAAQKTKEIGVRKVLGASVQDVLYLFGREFSRLLIIAFLIAAPVAWWVMSSWLSTFVYRTKIGADIFIAAIATTFMVALITVGYHSLKAAWANPVDSLRND
jgi:putative ABC transport system permease protein